MLSSRLIGNIRPKLFVRIKRNIRTEHAPIILLKYILLDSLEDIGFNNILAAAVHPNFGRKPILFFPGELHFHIRRAYAPALSHAIADGVNNFIRIYTHD